MKDSVKKMKVTSLGKTYSFTQTVPSAHRNWIRVELSVSGQYSYSSRKDYGDRRIQRSLAFSVPVKVLISSANSGEVIDTQEGLLGYDRSKSPAPKKEVFLGTSTRKDFAIPEECQGENMKFEITLEENTDYDFTFQSGTIHLKTDASGASSRDALGLQMVMAVVPMMFIAFLIIITGLLVGRKNTA